MLGENRVTRGGRKDASIGGGGVKVYTTGAKSGYGRYDWHEVKIDNDSGDENNIHKNILILYIYNYATCLIIFLISVWTLWGRVAFVRAEEVVPAQDGGMV